MKLKELLKTIDSYEVRGSDDILVSDICYHSQQTKVGSLFVAIPGFKKNAREFIQDAVRRGAQAVVFEGEFFDNLRATQVRVSGARLTLARLAAAFFVHPSRNFYLAGITGTNGKTTMTYLMESLWQEGGFKAGAVSTVDIRFNQSHIKTDQTTPESRDLQFLFAKMIKEGVEKVCMEVSSHGVDLARVAECDFDAGVFTNLSQDHLDFHHSMDAYFESKARFFTEHLLQSCKKHKLALICYENPYGKKLIKKLKDQEITLWTYGMDKKCDFYVHSIHLGLDLTKAKLTTPAGEITLEIPLLGRFNLLNVAAAVALAMHSGQGIGDIRKGLQHLPFVPGRMERIADSRGRYIYVDYAHTPDALKNVLEMLREVTAKRIFVVMGCGGDRDRSKRPMMGYEAGRLGDVVMVTSDNPRSEDPAKILADIMPGIKKSGLGPYKKNRGYFVEGDRKAAIQKVLELASKGEVVLVAGKGHEDYQILGNTRIHFSDQEVIKEFLK